MTLLQQVATVTVNISWLPVIGIGVFLADRFPRDRSYRVDELFESTAGTLNTRLVGKYLGCLLATLLPAFLAYCFVMVLLAYFKHTLWVLPLSLVTYTTIVVPGVCFVAAFTLACTSLMWVPLYQFLFIGYWFWGNMLGPKRRPANARRYHPDAHRQFYRGRHLRRFPHEMDGRHDPFVGPHEYGPPAHYSLAGDAAVLQLSEVGTIT